MKKKITLFLLLSLSLTIQAQQVSEKKAVQTTIENFFKGFHKGDTILLKKTIRKDLVAQTTFTTPKGEKVLRGTPNVYKTLMGFAKNVKPTDDYYEKILSYNIQIDGNLASVWTPYEFYNKGKFSHCGVNSFQLFNNNGNWEIIYLIDTRKRKGCNPSEK
ncbi:MAG: nuclear transport factor 2 family protein [Flavobacteriaceae bacterium]|nr:nuclear transport factor 2 family protein [Flavobacteriaceae bacterium]